MVVDWKVGGKSQNTVVFQPCLEKCKVIIIIIISHQLGLDRPVSAWIYKMASTFSFFPPEFGEIDKPVQ